MNTPLTPEQTARAELIYYQRPYTLETCKRIIHEADHWAAILPDITGDELATLAMDANLYPSELARVITPGSPVAGLIAAIGFLAVLAAIATATAIIWHLIR